MNDMTPTREQREAKLEGMGCKRKRSRISASRKARAITSTI